MGTSRDRNRKRSQNVTETRPPSSRNQNRNQNPGARISQSGGPKISTSPGQLLSNLLVPPSTHCSACATASATSTLLFAACLYLSLIIFLPVLALDYFYIPHILNLGFRVLDYAGLFILGITVNRGCYMLFRGRIASPNPSRDYNTSVPFLALALQLVNPKTWIRKP